MPWAVELLQPLPHAPPSLPPPSPRSRFRSLAALRFLPFAHLLVHESADAPHLVAHQLLPADGDGAADGLLGLSEAGLGAGGGPGGAGEARQLLLAVAGKATLMGTAH